MGNGVGCEYSCMGSLYFNISVISSSGREGNLFVNVFDVLVAFFYKVEYFFVDRSRWVDKFLILLFEFGVWVCFLNVSFGWVL